MSDWSSFWDSEHSIYVNARHKDAHYRRIADDRGVRAGTGGARARLRLRRGASHADRVAAVGREVILCDAAPSVRAAWPRASPAIRASR